MKNNKTMHVFIELHDDGRACLVNAHMIATMRAREAVSGSEVEMSLDSSADSFRCFDETPAEILALFEEAS